jgi:hypothetical protein
MALSPQVEACLPKVIEMVVAELLRLGVEVTSNVPELA